MQAPRARPGSNARRIARAAALAITRGLALLFSASLPVRLAAADGEILGARTCGTSNCHAAPSPWPNSAVSQREYATWKERDPHSRAWTSLDSTESRRIAGHLGIVDPRREPACLDCHATLVPSQRRGETYDVGEGVTCEACHGPASGWLGAHSSGLRFYAENLERGMTATADPAARAGLCLDCHVGDNSRFVDHRLLAAGHPPLVFDLAFHTWFLGPEGGEPLRYAHFTVDDDYQQRKPSPSGSKVWAIGQVAQARRRLELAGSGRERRASAFPEFSHYECRSCHRPIEDAQPSSDAFPSLSMSNVLLAAIAVELADPAVAARLRDGVRRLRESASHPSEAAPATTATLVALDAAEETLLRHDFHDGDEARLAAAIAGECRAGSFRGDDAMGAAMLAIAALGAGACDDATAAPAKVVSKAARAAAACLSPAGCREATVRDVLADASRLPR